MGPIARCHCNPGRFLRVHSPGCAPPRTAYSIRYGERRVQHTSQGAVQRFLQGVALPPEYGFSDLAKLPSTPQEITSREAFKELCLERSQSRVVTALACPVIVPCALCPVPCALCPVPS